MQAQQGLALSAIATILVVAKIGNIEAIPSKLKPGSSFRGRITTLPKDMMDFQTKIDNTITNTKKDIENVEKYVNKTQKDLVEKMSKDSSDAHVTVLKKEKKGGKEKECTKNIQKQYRLYLDDSLEKALECLNVTTEKSLENIEKAKQDFNDSYGIKDGHGPLNTQWFSCVFDSTNACEQQPKTEMSKRVEVTTKSSTETLEKVQKVKEDHKNSIEECLTTYRNNLNTDLKKYNESLQACNKQKN